MPTKEAQPRMTKAVYIAIDSTRLTALQTLGLNRPNQYLPK